MPSLYSIFHLNLMYSSIPVEKRLAVIKACYWPLLDLAKKSIPIAIEASAYTLEQIFELAPDWIREVKLLIQQHKIEFLGSGYSQLIGPLCPAEVNQWNLALGHTIYRDLLGISPDIWYLNEQAYSKGVVDHYATVDAKAIVMEWNNPRSEHLDWPETYRHFPQLVKGFNHTIPIIWNDAITFQKFQRYSHGEYSLDEMTDYLISLQITPNGFHCLYGNDAETFDFRPGRFHTESILEFKEWDRIEQLFLSIIKTKQFTVCLPSELLQTSSDLAFNPIQLETSNIPIPVKKQLKYNITRWALTGKNNVDANTQCYFLCQLLKTLISSNRLSEIELMDLKKELCYFFSSDFRTHITNDRWEKFNLKCRDFQSRLEKKNSTFSLQHPHADSKLILSKNSKKDDYRIVNHRFIEIKTNHVHLTLNKYRGLSIESLAFENQLPVLGTLPHGYYKHIALASDWYSGNFVLKQAGQPQITDLTKVNDLSIQHGSFNEEEVVIASSHINTSLGTVKKSYIIFQELPKILIQFDFNWDVIPIGSFKALQITLFSHHFDLSSLYYATHNGGGLETFSLCHAQTNHSNPSSSVVSASHCLGNTEGILMIGDNKQILSITTNRSQNGALPMVEHQRFQQDETFTRVAYSLGEIDESARPRYSFSKTYSFSLTYHQHG